MRFQPLNIAIGLTEPIQLYAQVPELPADGAKIRTISLKDRLCVFEWGDFARFEQWDFSLNLKHLMPIGGTHAMVWCQTPSFSFRKTWTEANEIGDLKTCQFCPFAVKIDILAFRVRHFLPGVSMIPHPNSQYFIARRCNFETQTHYSESNCYG